MSNQNVNRNEFSDRADKLEREFQIDLSRHIRNITM